MKKSRHENSICATDSAKAGGEYDTSCMWKGHLVLPSRKGRFSKFPVKEGKMRSDLNEETLVQRCPLPNSLYARDTRSMCLKNGLHLCFSSYPEVTALLFSGAMVSSKKRSVD